MLDSARRLGIVASVVIAITPIVTGALAFFLVRQVSIPYSSLTTTFLCILISALGFTGFLSIIGLPFVAASYKLSKYYGEPIIFRNILIGYILSLIVAILAIISDFGFLRLTIIPRISSTSLSVFSQAIKPVNFVPFPFMPFSVLLIISVALSIIFAFSNGILYMRGFEAIAKESGIEEFKNVGIVYLVGVLLSTMGMGVIVVWVAWVYSASAFRSLSLPKL